MNPFISIDWSAAWREAFLAHAPENATSEYWDKRAELFQNQARFDEYTRLILRRLRVGGGQSVLDVGCGVGNLTLPLAQRARTVTALDVSEPMLAYLRKNAAEAGLKNIEIKQLDWLEAGIGSDVPVHDIVVCSCAVVTPEAQSMLVKLNEAAGRIVYLSWEIAHPFHAAVYRALGRPYRSYPNYIYLYNLLYQLGIAAEVSVVKSRRQIQFESPQAALAHWRARLRNLSPQEEKNLLEFFQKELKQTAGVWIPRRPYPSSWALMSWRK